MNHGISPPRAPYVLHPLCAPTTYGPPQAEQEWVNSVSQVVTLNLVVVIEGFTPASVQDLLTDLNSNSGISEAAGASSRHSRPLCFRAARLQNEIALENSEFNTKMV